MSQLATLARDHGCAWLPGSSQGANFGNVLRFEHSPARIVSPDVGRQSVVSFSLMRWGMSDRLLGVKGLSLVGLGPGCCVQSAIRATAIR